MPFKNAFSKLFISDWKHGSFIVSCEGHHIDIVSHHKRQGSLSWDNCMENAFLLAPTETPTQISGIKCGVKCFT